MIVVADTSPLNYLVLVEQHDVLRRLYGRIVAPRGVVAEFECTVSCDGETAPPRPPDAAAAVYE